MRIYLLLAIAGTSFSLGWLTAAPHRATVTAMAAHVVVRLAVRVWPAG